MNTGLHPVPEVVRIELERLVRRWSQLPLDRALRHVRDVELLIRELSAKDARLRGRQTSPGRAEMGTGASDGWAPDLVMSVLTAVVWDLFAAARSASADERAALETGVAARLSAARAALADGVGPLGL